MPLVTTKSALVLLVSSSALALAGCSGNTYGTGKTQQEMLFSDLNGIIPVGTTKKKERINYASRPKLVPPPTTAALQPPAEKSQSQDAFFPVNPEDARVARRKAIDEATANGQDLRAAGLAPQRRTSTFGTASQRVVYQDKDTPGVPDPLTTGDGAMTSQERLARMRQISGTGGLGTAPRKYLTQPPVEYRTPAETAPVGQTGVEVIEKKGHRTSKSPLG